MLCAPLANHTWKPIPLCLHIYLSLSSSLLYQSYSETLSINLHAFLCMSNLYFSLKIVTCNRRSLGGEAERLCGDSPELTSMIMTGLGQFFPEKTYKCKYSWLIVLFEDIGTALFPSAVKCTQFNFYE